MSISITAHGQFGRLEINQGFVGNCYSRFQRYIGEKTQKLFLLSASPYFQQRIQEAETELSTVIVLDQVSSVCFGQLLDFIYVGKVGTVAGSPKEMHLAEMIGTVLFCAIYFIVF